jgi:hypothetical protein
LSGEIIEKKFLYRHCRETVSVTLSTVAEDVSIDRNISVGVLLAPLDKHGSVLDIKTLYSVKVYF